MLAMLTWTYPWWGLASAAAIALPVAAHLWRRRVRRQIILPTLRFLQAAEAQRHSPRRLRHWLLLALRCSVLLAITAALAQPVWRNAAAAGVSGMATASGQGRHHILLLDRSASMTRADAGVSLFDRATSLASTYLRQLDPSQETASIVLLDAHPRSLLPEPTSNIALLLEQLQAVTPTQERGNPQAAMAVARRLSAWRSSDDDATSPKPVRLTLLSDMQATQGPPVVDAGSAAVPMPLTLARLEAPVNNVALHHPRLEPAWPVAGQVVTASVEVSFFSADPQATRQAVIALRIEPFGDAPPAQSPPLGASSSTVKRQAINLPANTTATLWVDFTPAWTGRTRLQWRLIETTDAAGRDVADALPLDDTVGMTIAVAARRPVTLVTSADLNDATSASYFMARALSPGGNDAGVDLSVIGPSALPAHLSRQVTPPRTETTLRRPGVIILLEAGTLPDATLDQLTMWAMTGGGVLWVIDSPAALTSLRRQGQSHAATGNGDNENPWPLRPTGQATQGMMNQPLPIAAATFSDPPLDVFQGPARATLLDNTFFRWAPLNPVPAPGTAVLLALGDAQAGTHPLLAWRWHGTQGGRLAILAADVSPHASTLTQSPAFAPLIHQLVRALSPGSPSPPNPHPGQTALPIGFAADGTFIELHPDESDTRALDAASLAANSSDAAMTVTNVESGGSGLQPWGQSSQIVIWPWLAALAVVLAIVEQALAEGVSWLGTASRSQGEGKGRAAHV